MERNERRKTKRFGAKFNLTYREVGATKEKAHTGSTVNVATGGVYFETQSKTLKPGSLLEVELSNNVSMEAALMKEQWMRVTRVKIIQG